MVRASHGLSLHFAPIWSRFCPSIFNVYLSVFEANICIDFYSRHIPKKAYSLVIINDFSAIIFTFAHIHRHVVF